MTWVRWKQVIAKKEVHGLDVSSLFALNRALFLSGFRDFLLILRCYGL